MIIWVSFAGQSGSFLEVPDLAQRRLSTADSVLALEALRAGRVAPYGDVGENQKLGIALLDFFAQVANRIEDPGLLRLLMHRGELRDKVACLGISNVLLELKKQKNSRKFFEFVHAALHGRKPNRMLKWKVPRPYRFCIDHLEAIADSRHAAPEVYVDTVNRATSELFTELNRLMIARIQASGVVVNEGRSLRFSTEELIQNFEIPAQLSALLFGGENRHAQITGRQLRELMQSLSFPLLVTLVLAGSTVASTRLLYQNRGFLNEFAGRIGGNQHAARALHLTDTLFDRNGVSSSLGGKLREIQRGDLPIDLLVCHESAAAEPHLHVLRPLASVSLPDSGGQQLRVPDLMAIARIFYDGGYDRVICSTEGPMLLVALFLRYMFNVPAYFFMHSDWIEYIRCNLDITRHERDRVRRLLRLLYGQFDGVFALNSQHRDWLTGQEMQLEPARVHLTAHHAPEPLTPVVPVDRRELFADASADTPVLFLASRLSREKGLADLSAILSLARESLPDLRLVVAGAGPEEASLRAALPDACLLGWVERPRLAQLYAGLDLFIFPTRFDTFGNVLLEAFSYGMPAVAYNCKGPADIVQHGKSGWLADDIEGMATAIVRHFTAPGDRQALRAGARCRAADYSPERIMTRYLQDLGLPGACGEFDASSARVA